MHVSSIRKKGIYLLQNLVGGLWKAYCVISYHTDYPAIETFTTFFASTAPPLIKNSWNFRPEPTNNSRQMTSSVEKNMPTISLVTSILTHSVHTSGIFSSGRVCTAVVWWASSAGYCMHSAAAAHKFSLKNSLLSDGLCCFGSMHLDTRS